MKILITGASRGLGRSIAYELAKHGHHLVLVARNSKQLELLCKEISAHTEVEYIAADLRETDKIASFMKTHRGENSPDILINNLGIFQEGVASSLKIDELKAQMEVNLYAAISLTNCLLPSFKKNKAGMIINIGSVAALAPHPDAAAYTISKHALKGWNDALRAEMRKYNVKVSSLYPSSINTSSWDGVADVNPAKMIQKEDIARLIATMIDLSNSTLVEEIKLSPLQDFTSK